MVVVVRCWYCLSILNQIAQTQECDGANPSFSCSGLTIGLQRKTTPRDRRGRLSHMCNPIVNRGSCHASAGSLSR